MDMIMIYNKIIYERNEKGELILDETTNTYKTRELTAAEQEQKNKLIKMVRENVKAQEIRNGESIEEINETDKIIRNTVSDYQQN